MRELASKRFSPAAHAILPAVPTPLQRRWQFHELTIAGIWSAPEIGQRWCATFAPRPVTDAAPDLTFELALAPQVPDPPAGEPNFRQGDLLAYYLNGSVAVGPFSPLCPPTPDPSPGPTP